MNNSMGKGLLSYLLSVVGPLIVIFAFKDNNRKDLFHAYQSLTISIAVAVACVVLSIIAAIPVLGFISFIAIPAVSIFAFVIEVLAIIKVCKDEADPKLVLVGDLTEKIFGQQINAAPETVAATPQPSFDPNTGQPINQPTPESNMGPVPAEPTESEPAAPADSETPADSEAPAEEASDNTESL